VPRRMKPTSLLASLLFALLALAPLAAADLDESVASARVRTVNSETGDGCEGPNGSEGRLAEASIRLTDEEEIFARFSQSCTAWDHSADPDDPNGFVWYGKTESGDVSLGRRHDGNQGPYASVYWHDHQETFDAWESHWCGSGVYVAGPALHLGCTPVRIPMAPALP